MLTIEQYAIKLVCDGAQSTAEDDLNEDGELPEEQLEAACDLALKVVEAIRRHPDVVLELVELDKT